MVVETEKVSYDVESPLDGFLHIIVPVGETVPVETLVGKIASTEQELQSLQGDSSPAQEIAATSAATTVAPESSSAADLLVCRSSQALPHQARESRHPPWRKNSPPMRAWICTPSAAAAPVAVSLNVTLQPLSSRRRLHPRCL